MIVDNKKGLTIIFVVLYLFLPCVVFAEENNLTVEDFSFVKVKSNFTLELEKNYLELLSGIVGEPTIELVKNEHPSAPDFKNYIFDGIVISTYPSDDRVVAIHVTDSDYSTKRGITVGANKSDIISLYGVGKQYEGILQFNADILRDGLFYYDFYLSFHFKEDRVYMISVRVNPPG